MIHYEFLLFAIALAVIISISLVFSYTSNPTIETTAKLITDTKYKQNQFLVTISLVKGGFGNQLFKIATAFAYSKKTGKDLVFDVEEAVFAYPIENMKYFDSFYGWTKNIDITKYEWDTYAEQEGIFNEIPIFPKNVKLEGYFQSPRYFESYKKEILSLFYNHLFVHVPLHLTLLKDPTVNTVCVHFRYIDYVGNPQFDVLPADYYDKCIQYMQTTVENPIFIVFSDRIDYCKQYMKDLNCIFIEDGSEIDQHLWMSMCKHHIIPNSTFSWWAAYQNETGTVILPTLWCAPKFGSVWEDLKQKSWITYDRLTTNL